MLLVKTLPSEAVSVGRVPLGFYGQRERCGGIVSSMYCTYELQELGFKVLALDDIDDDSVDVETKLLTRAASVWITLITKHVLTSQVRGQQTIRRHQMCRESAMAEGVRNVLGGDCRNVLWRSSWNGGRGEATC